MRNSPMSYSPLWNDSSCTVGPVLYMFYVGCTIKGNPSCDFSFTFCMVFNIKQIRYQIV